MIEIKQLRSVCITPEVKLCVGLRNQDRAMATEQNPTHPIVLEISTAGTFRPPSLSPSSP